MGIYDRDYYDPQPEQRRFSFAGGQRMMVTNLVLITVAVFLVDAFTQGNQLVRLLSLTSDLPAQPWCFWRLLTYGFVHSPLGSPQGIWHIGMNMLVLWMFGRVLEWRHGPREFLAFYLTAIVIAGALWLVDHLVVRGDQPARLLGASGGVTAVFILFALTFPRETVYVWGVLAVPAWLFGALYVALDLLGMASGRGNVAYEAHLAGAAFALAYHYFGWQLSRWRLPVRWPRRTPPLKVRRPDSDLDELADQVLDKVHREGESSLTRRERKILEDYSRRVRQKRS